VPMMLAMMLTSIAGGRIVKKIGVRTQMLIGMITMAAGFWLLSTMVVTTSKWEAMSYMIVLGLGIGLVMPLITIALQESFPKSERGVVTSSSQFFRQIGGTFGMTVLGAVMNHRSTALLTHDLMPRLEKLPQQAHGMAEQFSAMIQTNPQGLYSMLLSPEALASIPAGIRQTLLPILKTDMVASLHEVYLVGLVFILAGAVLAMMLGKIKLSPPEQKASAQKAA
jgi:fucose permease